VRSTRRKYTSVRHTAPLAAVSDGTVERIHGAAQETSEPAEKLQIAALLAALLRQPLHTASPPKGLSAATWNRRAGTAGQAAGSRVKQPMALLCCAAPVLCAAQPYLSLPLHWVEHAAAPQDPGARWSVGLRRTSVARGRSGEDGVGAAHWDHDWAAQPGRAHRFDHRTR